MEWLLALLFGTSMVFVPNPISIPVGEMFFQAQKPIEPVSDGMRVNIAVGTTTTDAKFAVLSGSIKLGDYGDLKVAVCRTRSDCLALKYAGTYFSATSYGFIFSASDPSFKGSNFIGVKIDSARPLSNVTISWSNFVQ